MLKKRKILAITVAALSAFMPTAVSSQSAEQADKGLFMEQGRSPAWYFDQHKRVGAALAGLKPERKGVVDAFVVVAGIDADGVFGKEAVEAANVLSKRFDAVGRTVTLTASPGTTSNPFANPTNLSTILGGVASKMNLNEDVLILYTTSHGAPKIGIVFKDDPNEFGMISASRMAEMLNGLGIKRRLVMISACYSGSFVPTLKTDDSIVITAASAERSSFGCHPGNDWTFFGDALINGAMRTPMPLDKTVDIAFKTISGWETSKSLTPSDPQVFIGSKAKIWLAALEKRMPLTPSARVGKPALGE
jgi:Peptidase C13 family